MIMRANAEDTEILANLALGVMTIAGTTEGMNMLGGKTDACVLWDIRVSDNYKHIGVGQRLFNQGILGFF